MTRRGAGLFAAVAAAILAPVLLSGCARTVDGPIAKHLSPSPSVSSTPGPFAIPVDELVVPEALAPRRGESVAAIEADIRRAFGPMLARVSVVATCFATDDPYEPKEPWDFRIQYELVDCPVRISAFMPLDGLTESGMVPPLTQFGGTPPGRDWMSGERFRQLLSAYGAVCDKPCGGLESYATALRRNLDDREPPGQTATVDGKARPTADLWVVTAGADTQAEFRRLYRGNRTAGYVFSFPKGGAPEYLGVVKGLGAFSILTNGF